MNPSDKLKEIEVRYKQDKSGAVHRPAMTVQSVDQDKGVINFVSSEALFWSQEIEDIHYLLNRVKRLTEVANEADSYLSLIYHRYSSNLPEDLREEIGRAYSKARKALKGDDETT